MKSLLVILILFILIGQSNARVGVQNIAHPRNFTWKATMSDDGYEFNLDLKHKDGQGTQISYSGDFEYGWISKEDLFDNHHKIIITRPGRTLWEAHPGQQSELEKFFLESMYGLGYPKQTIPYIKGKDLNNLSFSTIDDFLEKIENKKANTTLESFIKKTKYKVSKTRKEIFKVKNDTINWIIKEYDIAEPIKQDEKLYAFNITPLNLIKTNGTHLLKALDEASKISRLNPIWWYYKKMSDYSQNIRLTILSLMTHNHLLEMNFIKATALKFGVRKAWKAAKAINRLYKHERAYWLNYKNNKRIVSKVTNYMNKIIESSGIAFLDKQVDRESKYLIPEYTRSSFNAYSYKDNLNTYLPNVKRYHYYGAFIMSKKLMNFSSVPKTLIPLVIQTLGSLYKSKTLTNVQEEEKTLMRRLYYNGAVDALTINRSF